MLRSSDISNIGNLKSPVGLFGIFFMRVFEHKTGDKRLFRKVIKRNQITNEGRSALLNLMYTGTTGANQETYRIWSLSVGINTTPPSISDDLAAMTPVWNSALDAGTGCELVEAPPNTYLLQVNKLLPETDAVGYALSEAGIFTRGDNDDPNASTTKLLYARQIFPIITKTNTMSIEFDWQLGITIQGA